MRLTDLDDWARRHHGLITLAASGLSNDSWHRAIRSGSLIPLHRHVARLPGTEPTMTQQIHAAVLAGGNPAMASHHSAAFLWGLVDTHDRHSNIVLSDQTRHPRLDGVIVHRPRDRHRLRPVRRAGVACTDPLRTLCDLGATHPSMVSSAVGTALGSGLVSLDALTATVLERSRRGRPGTGRLRDAIEEWSIDRRPADSVLELAFTDLVRTHRLPPVTFHERIEGWEIDFRFVGTAVLVECDGWSTHGLDRAQFERDRRKGLDIAAAGWQLLRLSYRSIVRDPSNTAALVRRGLERWGHLRAPDEGTACLQTSDPRHAGRRSGQPDEVRR